MASQQHSQLFYCATCVAKTFARVAHDHAMHTSRRKLRNKMLTMCKGHITRGNFPCNLQRNGVALQVARKISSCDTPCLQLVSQRKIALRVAEKVEAASTFRTATRQVAACDTPTATCLAIF